MIDSSGKRFLLLAEHLFDVTIEPILLTLHFGLRANVVYISMLRFPFLIVPVEGIPSARRNTQDHNCDLSVSRGMLPTA